MDPGVTRAKQFLQTNRLAGDTRINGQFTSEGLANADRIAELDAQDRARAKYMIGLGATVSPMGPGNF